MTAENAYRRGQNAAKDGKSIKDNPYTTAKLIGLKNWWDKGYNDSKTQTN
jgi:hypothetical protein